MKLAAQGLDLLAAPLAHERVTRIRAHRPWPLPERSWTMAYVTVDGKPGIYFFSLDANSRLGVATARRTYRLPYFRARMSIERDAGAIRFTSRRIGREAPAPADFHGRYRPVSATFQAAGGSLEHWLTERYCLYTFDDRRGIQRADIHHPPWPLQHAEADIDVNTMAAEIGVDLRGEPLLHYARRQDVVFWTLRPAADERPPGAQLPADARGRG